MERSLEHLAQNLVRSIQSSNETQKMVAFLAGQMNVKPQRGEGGESGNRSSEEVSRSKGKSLDQAEGVAAGRGEPGTGHGIETGGWAPANSSLPASGEWQGN